MSTPPPIVFQPNLWYDVTAQDVTETCPNFGKTFEVNPCWSNNGTVNIECGVCRQMMQITAATLLDPQPEMA